MWAFFSSWMAVPLMAFEFLLFGFFHARRLKREEYFYVRFFALGVLLIAGSIVFEMLFAFTTGGEIHYGRQSEFDYRVTLSRFLFFLLLYALTFLIFKISYKERASTVFLVCAASFATQHLAHNVGEVFGLFSLLTEDVFLSDLIKLLAREFAMALALGALVYYDYRRGELANPYEGNRRKKVFVSTLVVLICIGLYRIKSDINFSSRLANIGFSLYAIASCGLLLFIFYGLYESDKTHAEAEAYRELVHQQKAQYELSKRNIDLINIKCHDLKHQIHALKTKENEPFVKELEEEVMIYDASLRTGNDVLDVILREKLLESKSEGVELTCFLEGEAIAFMDEMDIYSLFGNLLSNAFESVSKVKEKGKRAISISGRNVGNLFFLHEENYFEGSLSLSEGGLPKSTKGDDDFHGFGMKSMRRVATKYGGEMAVKIEGELFSVDFVFPIPEKV